MAKKSMKERELKMYDGFYYYCHPLKYSIFHTIIPAVWKILLGCISLIIMIWMQVALLWLRRRLPLHFISIPVPGYIPTWLTFLHVWQWCVSAAVSFLSQRFGGRGLSVLNYHFFCFSLNLKRRLYLFRCQQELKTPFQTGRSTQADFIA